MSETTGHDDSTQDLNPDGVGLGDTGEPTTFEPEEDPDAVDEPQG